MALPTTRAAMRRYGWRLIFRAIGSVLVLNVLNALLVRTDATGLLLAFLAAAIVLAALYMLGAVLSYFRYLFIRMVLRRTEWSVVSGSSRAVYVGPIPFAQVAVVDFGGDEKLAVDYAGPLYFSKHLPGEIMPANILVAQWQGMRVYSGLDGASPTFGVRVRPGFLRNLYLNVVPHV